MKKRAVILFFLLFFITFLIPKRVEAFDCSFSTNPDPIYITSGNRVDKIGFTFQYSQNDFKNALKSSQFGGKVLLRLSYPSPDTTVKTIELGAISSANDLTKFASNPISYTYELNFFTSEGPVFRGDHQAWVEYQDTGGNLVPICDKQTYSVLDQPASCKITADHDGLGDIDSNFWVTISDLKLPPSYSRPNIVFDFNLDDSLGRDPVQPPNTIRVDVPKSYIKSNIDSDREHTVQVFPANTVQKNGTIPRGDEMCRTTFKVAPRGATPIPNTPTPTPTLSPTPTITPTPPDICYTGDWFKREEAGYCGGDYIKCDWCKPTAVPTRRAGPKIQIPNLKPLCDQLPDEDSYRSNCWKCQQNGEIWSAIGCLPTDFSKLINKYVFTTGAGIAGSIAFLYFIYGAFLILTSAGNAERLEEAKQIITSSLAGLLLIIFSIFLLKVIGVDILQLPGFSGS